MMAALMTLFIFGVSFQGYKLIYNCLFKGESGFWMTWEEYQAKQKRLSK